MFPAYICVLICKKCRQILFFRTVGLTTNEILGQLENSDDDTPVEGYGIILIPPEEELLTDEDSDEEDEDGMSMDPNHLGKGILSSQAELVVFDDDELPDLTTVRCVPIYLFHVTNYPPPYHNNCKKNY
jgi:hypothetical protein